MRLIWGLTGIAVMILAARIAPAADGIQVRSLYGRTPRDLALVLTGCGVEIRDVKYIGTTASAGTFSATPTGTIGFTSGVILSTGLLTNVPGPNASESTGASNNLPGDPDLQALVPSYTVQDATVLEFEFVPSGTTVTFDYVFASDEYNEYANTAYNDVFAFYLNGKNVALLPGTATPVSINNVNGGNPYGNSPQNSGYYISNASDSCSLVDPRWSATRFNDLEMDGLTVVFTVTATVDAGVINRIKFAVADAGDSIYDSVVFIRAGSFSSNCGPPAGTTSTTFAIPAPDYGLHGFPNPFRPGSGGNNDAAGVYMDGVPAGGTVRVYSAGGALVASLSDGDADGRVFWNARNAEGRNAASGVYLIVARGLDGTLKRGRVVIIR